MSASGHFHLSKALSELLIREGPCGCISGRHTTHILVLQGEVVSSARLDRAYALLDSCIQISTVPTENPRFSDHTPVQLGLSVEG